MKQKHTFFKLIDLSYSDANLTIRVAELVEGKPDGYIGTHLLSVLKAESSLSISKV
jgi:hypothetical protein